MRASAAAAEADRAVRDTARMRKAPPASVGGRFLVRVDSAARERSTPCPALSRSSRRTRPRPRQPPQPPQPLPPAVRGSGRRDSTNDCGLRGLGLRGSRAVTAGTAGETAGRAAGGNRGGGGGRTAQRARGVVDATLGGRPASGCRIRYLWGSQRVTRRRAPGRGCRIRHASGSQRGNRGVQAGRASC
jgi:hypothetical protein